MKERIEEEVSSTENDVSRRKVRGERREGIDMREKEEERKSWREEERYTRKRMKNQERKKGRKKEIRGVDGKRDK